MDKKHSSKPAQPIISEFSHYSATLHWKECHDQFTIANPNTKILSELSMITDKSNEGWKKIYIGYATNFTTVNLQDATKYAFRLRFKIKDDWTVFSDPIVLVSLEKPMTGEHIHKAVRNNNIRELELVLENSKANIEAQDGLGFTPLMVASQKRLIDIMKLLLKSGADIEAKTESGKSALMLVCHKGEREAIDLLIEYGANVNNTDKSRLSAMHYAVDGESTRAIRILGAAGAAVDSTDSILGWSPLLRCAGLKNNGNVEVAKELIKLGANINLQDKEGNSPLHLSVINGHYKLFELLLDAGAELRVLNKLKNSVLRLIEYSDNTAMKQKLQQYLSDNK